MDVSIFQFINQFAGRWMLADRAAIFLAQYSGYVLIGVLISFAIFSRRRWLKVFLWAPRYQSEARYGAAQNRTLFWFWALAAAFVARFVVTEIIRFFYNRPRPFEVMDVAQLLTHSPEASLPSGHAAFYFALSWFVFFYSKKLGTIFLVVTSLMGLSRIFSGIHYPADILAGFMVGLISASLLFWAKKWYSRKVFRRRG